MADRLSYDLPGPGELTIIVPEVTLRQAHLNIPDLRLRLRSLQGRSLIRSSESTASGETSRSFRIGLKALGKIAVSWRKINAVVDVTDAVRSLVMAPTYNGHAEKLAFSSFSPISLSDFSFLAYLNLPEAEPSVVAPFVRNTMTETIRAMQLYQHTTEFILEDGPEVSIDREEGVKLRLGPQSSVHTLGEDYVPGQRQIELMGNNVSPYGEPLVYLMGAVALAHADTYVSQNT